MKFNYSINVSQNCFKSMLKFYEINECIDFCNTFIDHNHHHLIYITLIRYCNPFGFSCVCVQYFQQMIFTSLCVHYVKRIIERFSEPKKEGCNILLNVFHIYIYIIYLFG